MAPEFYNAFLGIYFDECNELSDDKRNKIGNKYKPNKLFIEEYNYDGWSENEELPNTTRKSDKVESSDEKSTDLPPIPLLQGDKEEVKEWKLLKMSTPNKLLTRLLILFSQV